jgi:hypothetical protein
MKTYSTVGFKERDIGMDMFQEFYNFILSFQSVFLEPIQRALSGFGKTMEKVVKG